MARYLNRQIIKNDTEQYRSFRDERGVKHIRHYSSPDIIFPTEEQIKSLDIKGHIWTFGDRLYKLATTYYSDPKLWWVIALYNNKPTESHIEIGENIYIPLPAEEAISLIRI